MPPTHPILPYLLQDAGGGTQMVLMLVAMFAIMYFVAIRPQQREKKKREAMVSALKKGDKVLTQSGIMARVQQVKDQFVILDLDGTARIKVVKDAIVRRLGEPGETPAGKEKSAREEATADAAGS